MTVTTASGLLPAGIAVYVQRGAERSSFGNTIFGWAVKALALKAKDADPIDYCQLGKMQVD